jgi:ligand-binding sensor domain-containing protein
VPSYSEINAFDVDKNGNLWVSSDEGLFKFNSNGVLIKKVSSLVNIRFIKADSYNNIWLRVNFGIMQLNEGGV